MPQAATLRLLSCGEPTPKCALSGSLSALQLHSLPSLSSWTALLSPALRKASTITLCSFSVPLHLLQPHGTASLYRQPLLPCWFSWMCSVLEGPSLQVLEASFPASLCALIQGIALKRSSRTPLHVPSLPSIPCSAGSLGDRPVRQAS